MYIHTYTYVYTHVYTCIHMYVCTCIYIHTCVCMYICIYIHIYIYIYTYIHACLFIVARSDRQSCLLAPCAIDLLPSPAQSTSACASRRARTVAVASRVEPLRAAHHTMTVHAVDCAHARERRVRHNCARARLDGSSMPNRTPAAHSECRSQLCHPMRPHITPAVHSHRPHATNADRSHEMTTC